MPHTDADTPLEGTTICTFSCLLVRTFCSLNDLKAVGERCHSLEAIRSDDKLISASVEPNSEQHTNMPAILRLSPPDGNTHSKVSSFESMDSIDERNPSDYGSTSRVGFMSRRKRLHSLTNRTKTKAKALLKLEKHHGRDDEGHGRDESVSEQIDDNPAFNPSKAVKKDPAGTGGAGSKASGALHTMVENLAHPIDTIKSKATRTTAGLLSEAERPKPSQESDANLLQAHIDLNQVQASSSSRLDLNTPGQDPLENELRQKVEDMEAHRQSLRVAWITSRHVDRVRVVPKRHVDFPNDEAFVERDIHGEVVRYEWLKWLGYVSVEQLLNHGCVS